MITFFGSFDAPWSEWSSINLFSKETQNPFSDLRIQTSIFPKKLHPSLKDYGNTAQIRLCIK